MIVLLVCAAPVAGTCELLPGLAADADLVIAVDGGGTVCLEAGVMPDVVLGDFDSLPAADLDHLREMGAALKRFPADKEASDLELAVGEARSRGADTIVVTAASSARLDHTVATLGVLSAARDLRPHLVEPELEVWALHPEGRDTLELTGAGATVSILSCGGPARVSAEGVVWRLEDEVLESSRSRGLSNRIGQSGRARISVSRGSVLVFAPRLPHEVRAQEG